MFIYTNQPLITSFYIKKCLFFAELALFRNFLRNRRMTGKPIVRVRVKTYEISNFNEVTNVLSLQKNIHLRHKL